MLIRRITRALLFTLFLTLLPLQAAAAGTTLKKVDLDTFDAIIMDASTVNLVVAMAAWCKPCREELPTLEKLHRQYSPAKLAVIGLSLDANAPKDLQPLLDKHQVSFPVYWVQGDATRKYKIYGMPMMLVIKNGEIIEKIPGQRSETFLNKKIAAYLEMN